MKLKISVFFQSPVNVFLFRHMSPRVAQAIPARHRLSLLPGQPQGEEGDREERPRRARGGRTSATCARSCGRHSRASSPTTSRRCSPPTWTIRTVSTYVDEHFKVQGVELLQQGAGAGQGLHPRDRALGSGGVHPLGPASAGLPTSVILECATAQAGTEPAGKDLAPATSELISSSYGGSIFLRAMQSLKSNRVLMTQCDEVDAWRKRTQPDHPRSSAGAVLRQHHRRALPPLGRTGRGRVPQAVRREPLHPDPGGRLGAAKRRRARRGTAWSCGRSTCRATPSSGTSGRSGAR